MSQAMNNSPGVRVETWSEQRAATARPAGIPERGRRGMRRKTAQHHEQNGQNSRRVATNFI